MFLLKKTIMYKARQLSKTEGKMKILMILFINVVNIVKKPLRSEHPVCSKGLSGKETIPARCWVFASGYFGVIIIGKKQYLQASAWA